jgi:glycosyltransferase involved in cell wall biosynthesis
MDVPFFSVVITTYNRAELLKRALESLVLQTEKEWDAVIVDDESTDNTYRHIEPYLDSYPAIRYLRKEHSGEPLSKNAGIFSSEGKYITFLDSDDEYAPDHLELRKKILEGDTPIKFLHGGVRIIGNPYVPDRFDPEKSVSLGDCIIGGTFFIDRNLMNELEGFRNIPLGSDADLYDRALEKGITVKKVQYPTYIYHHETEDSITNRLFEERKFNR